MNLSEFSVVNQNNVLIAQQISDHPNFQQQIITREVVIEEILISSRTDFNRGFKIDYYINHYNNNKIDNSFVKSSAVWTISDDLLIAERDFNDPELKPIVSEDYLKAVEANKLGATIDNPDYVSDEVLSKTPKLIKNPDYVSDEDTPEVINLLLNPDYDRLFAGNAAGPTIPNPDYVSDAELEMIPQYKKSPAFSYLLSIIKEKPYLLFTILSFYINEQDADGFFDAYTK